MLKYTNKVFRHFYSKAYIDLVNKAPEVLGWLYDYLDDPKKNDDPVRAGIRPPQCEPVHPLSPAVSARRGDLHPFPAVGDHLLAEGGGEDQGLELGGGHRLRRARHVAVPPCGAVLRRPGGDEGPPQGAGGAEPLITVSGIPIDPVFAVRKDKRAMRRKHGLEEDRFTILVSAGGFGVGPVGHLMKALAGWTHPAQVVAVCGRNEALRAELYRGGQDLPEEIRRSSFTLLGFTTEMDELMTAADLFVGKPGGLTTSEVLAKGLPMVVINPIPGQEERNSDHLLEEGVAIRCNNLPALAYKIDTLLDTPGKLAQYERERAERWESPKQRLASG